MEKGGEPVPIGISPVLRPFPGAADKCPKQAAVQTAVDRPDWGCWFVFKMMGLSVHIFPVVKIAFSTLGKTV